MGELDERVRLHLAAGEVGEATTLVLRELGAEVYGFLCGVLGDSDADEVFSALSVRLWQSLRVFESRCAIRTWTYVLARQQIGRFRRCTRRFVEGRVPLSELSDILAVARKSRSMATAQQRAFEALRNDLPVQDRSLLILRVDRGLSWDEIALAFAEAPETFGDEERKREAARLRKRFQLVKRRLVVRAQDALLI